MCCNLKKRSKIAHRIMALFRAYPEYAFTPTSIGLRLGYSYNSASGSILNAMRPLIKKGTITRISLASGVYYHKTKHAKYPLPEKPSRDEFLQHPLGDHYYGMIRRRD